MRKIFRRKKDLPWPESLQLLSGAIRAGVNLDQALAIFYEEAPPLMKSYLKGQIGGKWPWMTVQQKIDVIFSDPQLDLVRSVLYLSMEAGVKQADLIDRAGELLREKKLFEERVAAMTSHGRVTAWVVGLSPLIMGGLLSFLAPEMVSPLIQTEGGKLLLVSCLGLIAVGMILVHKMSHLES